MDTAEVRPRLVFMGTPELARVILAALADDSRWEVSLVVAQPDKPVGRGLRLQAPPVKCEAVERGIPVLQPAKARDPEFLAALERLHPDLVVVAAYGQILPPSLLALPRRGCLNVHTSLLPRWRGAAPIQWALLEGDAVTGVTLMEMDAGLDTGGIVAAESTPIEPSDTGQTLHDRLAGIGARLLTSVLPDWLGGRMASVAQPAEGVTYARKLAKEDGRLDWAKPVAVLDRMIRAMNPWPGAFTTMPGERGEPVLLKLWEARPVMGFSDQSAEPGQVLVAHGVDLVIATGVAGEALRVESLQREGRRRMSAREFLAGGGVAVGVRLGGQVGPGGSAG